MSAGKVLFCFSTGMAVGAFLGVLFAPEKGKGMEAGLKALKIKDDYIDEMKQKYDKVIDGISEKLDKVVTTVNEIADQTQAKLESAKLETRKSKELNLE